METISYYDNVKDSVKETDDTGKPNFETLRRAAEENTEKEEEREGDGTEIEILEDGLSDKKQVQRQKKEDRKEEKNEGNQQESGNPLTSDNSSSQSESFDTSALEDKLETIIDQNQRMIEILESFGS